MEKIFIVEDDPLMIRMYERVFKLSNFNIEMAFDGEEALGKISGMAEMPAVILLDIMMPKMSGFDVLKKLRENEKTKKVPVIVLTNLAGKEDAERAMKIGATAYLVKSEHDPKDVVRIVKETLGKKTEN